MPNEKLKPCPFCGATPEYILESVEGGKLGYRISHFCAGDSGVFIETFFVSEKQAAIAAWNKRVTE